MNTARVGTINLHLRADKQNRLLLRTDMTEQDREVIRTAGRREDTLPARLLKERMEQEYFYATMAPMIP
ncbi:hypothetical protein AZE42_09613 [Rhizopogon vesiculosus]|uniref:DUF8205 domain-containing protein n=1 Tax=Rhizopogon vesiculosus TaxID=180088 RepID=A0A1J8Q6U1_9AGAM|nr:hypothetical protein AZE42_09613 [Rhizopogon vesiculosus]